MKESYSPPGRRNTHPPPGIFLSVVVPPTVPAQLSATASACCGRNLSSTELQPSNIAYPVPNGHTYLCRRKAAKARFDNRHSTSAPTPTLTAVSGSGAGTVLRSGASAFFVSDGPISSNSGRNGGKNAGRNCVSALPQRATVGSDLLRILADIAFHHRCRSKGLRVRSPARRLARPLAPATAGVFRSCRRTSQAFPLDGSRC